MWQPRTEHASAVASLISEALGHATNDRHREIAGQFDSWTQEPELAGYLTHIMASSVYPAEVRVAAGYSLKSTLEKLQKPVAEDIQVYIRRGLEHALTDPVVQQPASSLAATVYLKLPCNTLILDIVFRLIHEPATLSVGLASLCKIIEDVREDSELWKQLESPEHSQALSLLIPKVIDCSNTAKFKVVNQLLFIMPSALIPWVSRYTEEVLRSTSTFDMSICEAILTLSTLRKDLLRPHFAVCADYMLRSLVSPHARLSCDFWVEWLEKPLLVEPHLPQLLHLLLELLIITDQDLMSLMPESDTEFRYDKGEGEGHWTIRKEAACLLDKLSDAFGPQCFTLLQSDIQTKLLSAQWQQQESGLLALGALTFGSGPAIRPYLPNLLPYLWDKMSSPERLVRAMALWTASRLTDDIVGLGLLQEYLARVMRGVGDGDAVVRTAACTAFCVLVTRESEELRKFVEEVMTFFATALPLYKGRSLLSLLDAISSLAEAQPDSFSLHPQPLLDSLMSLWRSTDNSDRLIWAIYETLSATAAALGPSFSTYCGVLLERCVHHITQALADALEKQFGVKALELLGACVESAGTTLQPTLEALGLISLTIQCLGDQERAIRQYACATLGDIVATMPDCVGKYGKELVPRLTGCLELLPEGSDVHDTFLSAANNAICTLGEIAIRAPAVIREYIPDILLKAISLWKEPVRLPQFRANVMAAIGKMGVSEPSAVGEYFRDYFPAWCRALATVPASQEKGDSYLGALGALTARADVAFKHFGSVVEAVLNYPEALEAVRTASLLLFSTMQRTDPTQWSSAVDSLSLSTRSSLQALA